MLALTLAWVRTERELREREGGSLTASEGEQCRGTLQLRLRPLRTQRDARARGAGGGEHDDGELHSSRRVRSISRPREGRLSATANTRPSSMSSLFLTEFPPTPLCAHLLVLTFGTTARYYTHVSELSS